MERAGGFALARAADRGLYLERNLASLHEAAADQEAQRVSSHLQSVQQAIEPLATDTIPWDELSAEEREAALWRVFRAHDDIAVAGRATGPASRARLQIGSHEATQVVDGGAPSAPTWIPPSLLLKLGRPLPSRVRGRQVAIAGTTTPAAVARVGDKVVAPNAPGEFTLPQPATRTNSAPTTTERISSSYSELARERNPNGGHGEGGRRCA